MYLFYLKIVPIEKGFDNEKILFKKKIKLIYRKIGLFNRKIIVSNPEDTKNFAALSYKGKCNKVLL